MAEFLPPTEEILLANFIVSDDVERSRRFYTEARCTPDEEAPAGPATPGDRSGTPGRTEPE
jgi:hypothetical protein